MLLPALLALALAADPATAPAAAPVAVATESRAGVWRVRPGDTLWSISRDTGLPMDELCRLNGIGNPRRHTLQVGVTLVVAPTRG